MLWVVRTRMRAPVGMLTGVFMIAYAALRIVGEQFREPDLGIAVDLGADARAVSVAVHVRDRRGRSSCTR